MGGTNLGHVIQDALQSGHEIALVLPFDCRDACRTILTRYQSLSTLPITTETWARPLDILKAGVKEWGEERVLGRKVWMAGRLRS